MQAPTELCIVEDDDAVRDSLLVLLRSHGLEATAFPSAEAFLAHLDAGAAPACIVSDVKMTGMSGLDLLAELKRRGSPAPIILITGHGQISMAVGAIKSGAEDFIEKPFDEMALVEAIRRAAEKGLRQAGVQSTREQIRARIAELSSRQREVMDLVVQGYSSKEIAAKLGISPRTVETYRLWIMEKMDARNLADLVRKVSLIEAA
jgi:two-component system response regulator FixJ